MKARLSLALACILLCTGCAVVLPSQTTPMETPAVTPSPSAMPTALPEGEHTPTPAPNPIVFPKPTSALFGLTGDDAVLYDAAVERFFPKSETDDSLILPSISVLASYPDKAGNINYVCILRPFSYYHLANGLADPRNPQYVPSFGGAPARFTLAKQPDGSKKCIEILELPDGMTQDGFTSFIHKEMFGPHKTLAEAYLADPGGFVSNPPPETRHLTTTGPAEMLDFYLEQFFIPKENRPPYRDPIGNRKRFSFVPHREYTAEEAALILAKRFMDDLMTESTDRTFRVMAYKDLSVRIVDTSDPETVAIYGLSKDALLPGAGWLVEISIKYQYEGIVSPIGPWNNEMGWVDVLYQSSPVGFWMTKPWGSAYIMQSRYFPPKE